ncbi:MAG: cytochrome [Chitinophagaceae bacterium]|jgi:mono/diheme cytochrome c family protein|nr:cytochrome [Chitinophagaceae bacterium]
MRKFFKWTGLTVLFLIVALVVIVWALQYKTYDAEYPNVRASSDSAVIERGRYIVTSLGHCADCHAPENAYEDVMAGREVSLHGGRVFKLPLGTVQAPNITNDPTGIGDWKDEEIARSLRHGVGKDGRALFAFMPFQDMTDDDLTAVISYLRTTKPVKNEITVRKLNPMGYFVNAFFIKPVGPAAPPQKYIAADTMVEYGQYLANSVSNCKGCHTNRDLKTGAFLGAAYAGGFHMESVTEPQKWEVVTPNLTPDPETGHITNWNEQKFIERFRQGKVISHSTMPWGPFKRMSDLELKAIYKYLKTLKPEKNDPGPMVRELK